MRLIWKKLKFHRLGILMSAKHVLPQVIRVHLTNVTGAGATQLLNSLLPALIRSQKAVISEVFLPSSGELSDFSTINPGTNLQKYGRLLPNQISRFLECTFLAFGFNGSTPLLVLGDLPLMAKAPQILFVQTPHLLKSDSPGMSFGGLKYLISRFIFRLNLGRVTSFIVQTDIMRDALVATYPSILDRVYVIPHPVPHWLLGYNPQRQLLPPMKGRGLRLIYPSAEYPHKNHGLLSQIQESESVNWPVDNLVLTLNPSRNPAPLMTWISCVGFLSSAELIDTYGKVDALLFLSNKESFGFPLLEAMFLGLPVVCPDLPYAHWMCDDQAIYFDPKSIESLKLALERLRGLLIDGWRPDWSGCLKKFPKNWDIVASKMIDISLNAK